MKLIDKDSVLSEIDSRIEKYMRLKWKPEMSDPEKTQCKIDCLRSLKGWINNSLEVKEVDLELITGWFDHIAQIADDRMTLTNQRMTDAHALDEIKCLAKNSSEFITKHYKAQKGE